jgi:hypothetical protein
MVGAVAGSGHHERGASDLRIHSGVDLNVVFINEAMLCELVSVFRREKSAMSSDVEIAVSKRFLCIVPADGGCFIMSGDVGGNACGITGARSSLRQFI